MKLTNFKKCMGCFVIFFSIGTIAAYPMIIRLNPDIQLFLLVFGIIFFGAIVYITSSYLLNLRIPGKYRKIPRLKKKELIKKLLEERECEFLDFKSQMYDIISLDKKRKQEQKAEFIKDVLSLVNNKTKEKNLGVAFLQIGVGEENDKFNGKITNIEKIDEQPFLQALNNYITPQINLDFIEYYIRIEGSVEISLSEKDGFYRNYLIQLNYEVGTHYMIKKKLYSKNTSYIPTTSWTRDCSHTRLTTKEDIIKILKL